MTPRPSVISAITRALVRFETIFTDYQRGCPENCMRCERCLSKLAIVSRMLTDPNSLFWEVWSTEEAPRLCGIVYLTHIATGCDALCHYVFFDQRLKDKAALLNALAEWCFTSRPGWPGLRRLTVHVPDYALGLARHAHYVLGFGGDYPYTMRDGTTLSVEGVMRNAIRWHDADHDMLILGRLNGS